MSFDVTANRRLGPDILLTLPVVLLVVFALPWIAFRVAYQQYVPLIVGVFVVADICFTFAWWRASVYIFVTYVLVEGFAINAFSIPSLNLLKDVQLLLIFGRLALALVARRTFPVPHAGWVIPYFMFAVYYAAEIFNPLLPSILVGLIGARVTLLYFLCFIVGYWFFNDWAQVIRFLRFHNLLSIPISIFGVVQYFTGPDLLLSISPGFERAIFYAYDPNNLQEGYYFRTLSTFASSGGFSQYLWIAALLTLAFMRLSNRPSDRILCGVALLAQTCGTLSTGGRGPFILLFFSVFLCYWLVGQFRQAVAGGLLLSVCFVAGIAFLGPVVRTRYATILDLDMIRDRNMGLAVGEFGHSMDSPIVGLGAGRACNATLRAYPDLDVYLTENQFARIRNEGGLAGLGLFALFIGALALETWRATRLLRLPDLRILGCYLASFCLTNIFVLPIGQPLDVPPANFYFWFSLGLLHVLVRFQQSENYAGLNGSVPARPAWSALR